VGDYLRGSETVEQLLVLKTDVGEAQPLAIAIDRAKLPEIAGTIAGDDTILGICRSANDAAALAKRLAERR
jgi:transcriptional regulator of arginine metabolism